MLHSILSVIMIVLDLTILPENYRLYHTYNKPHLGKWKYFLLKWWYKFQSEIYLIDKIPLQLEVVKNSNSLI